MEAGPVRSRCRQGDIRRLATTAYTPCHEHVQIPPEEAAAAIEGFASGAETREGDSMPGTFDTCYAQVT